MSTPTTRQSTDRPLTMDDQPPTPDTEYSWELIERARTGDRQAFEELYNRYVNVVFRFVLFRVDGDRALAEDLTSETFLRALRRIETYRDRVSDPGAWFVTIARNLILDHYKSSRVRLTSLVCDFASLSKDIWPLRRVDPPMATQVANRSAYDQLWDLVRQLTPEQREVVGLRFVADLPNERVAEVTGSTVGAIKAMQHRAVRRLAKLMTDELADCLRGD